MLEMAVLDPSTFFRDYYPAVVGFISASTGAGSADVEDLAQETLLQAWRDRERFRGEADPQTWILAIAKNRVADFLRKSWRRSRHDAAMCAISRIDTEEIPESVLESAEFGSRIRAALRAISEEEAALLVSRYCEEMSVRAIASERGESEDAVESRLRRARESLKRRLAEEVG